MRVDTAGTTPFLSYSCGDTPANIAEVFAQPNGYFVLSSERRELVCYITIQTGFISHRPGPHLSMTALCSG